MKFNNKYFRPYSYKQLFARIKTGWRKAFYRCTAKIWRSTLNPRYPCRLKQIIWPIKSNGQFTIEKPAYICGDYSWSWSIYFHKEYFTYCQIYPIEFEWIICFSLANIIYRFVIVLIHFNRFRWNVYLAIILTEIRNRRNRSQLALIINLDGINWPWAIHSTHLNRNQNLIEAEKRCESKQSTPFVRVDWLCS